MIYHRHRNQHSCQFYWNARLWIPSYFVCYSWSVCHSWSVIKPSLFTTLIHFHDIRIKGKYLLFLPYQPKSSNSCINKDQSTNLQKKFISLPADPNPAEKQKNSRKNPRNKFTLKNHFGFYILFFSNVICEIMKDTQLLMFRIRLS